MGGHFFSAPAQANNIIDYCIQIIIGRRYRGNNSTQLFLFAPIRLPFLFARRPKMTGPLPPNISPIEEEVGLAKQRGKTRRLTSGRPGVLNLLSRLDQQCLFSSVRQSSRKGFFFKFSSWQYTVKKMNYFALLFWIVILVIRPLITAHQKISRALLMLSCGS